ncbi:unnamed protein product [Symbiodinium sp. CCMP2592]|nr:unnamed protein product [Symbiodinium sp. CCMP2592]
MSSTVYLGPRPPPRGYPGEGPVVDRFAKWRAKLGRDLLSAAEEGNAAVVKVCLEQKADPSVISLDSGRSPLHGAAASGNVEVMRDLIHASVRARVDLSLADNSKRTALDEALDVPQRLHMPADLVVPLLAAAEEAPEIVTELQTSLPKWRQALLAVLSCCTTPLPLVHEAALASVLGAWCFTGARGGPPSKVQELRRALFTSVANNNHSAVVREPGCGALLKAEGRLRVSPREGPCGWRSAFRTAPIMPKFYCEYCDMFLGHRGTSGRRQHMTGRRHINNKIEFYQMLIREKGLTPPIYPPPPGMVLPMPKLPAAAAPKPALGGILPGMPRGINSDRQT